VVNISLATPDSSGIKAIDWVNGSNSLSLVFESPLTTAGGTIPLNNIASDFGSDLEVVVNPNINFLDWNDKCMNVDLSDFCGNIFTEKLLPDGRSLRII
jgi:hypothetical protein